MNEKLITLLTLTSLISDISPSKSTREIVTSGLKADDDQKGNDLYAQVVASLESPDTWDQAVSAFGALEARSLDFPNLKISLEALRSREIIPKTSGKSGTAPPIDAFTLGWRWHPCYYYCNKDLDNTIIRMEEVIENSTSWDESTINGILSQRKCHDVREKDTKLAALISFAVPAIRKKKRLNGDVDEFCHRGIQMLDGFDTDKHDPKDPQLPPSSAYVAKAGLMSILGEEQKALDILYNASRAHIDDNDISDAVIQLVADPRKLEYTAKIQDDIEEIKDKLENLKGCDVKEILESFRTWGEAESRIYNALGKCELGEKGRQELTKIFKVYFYKNQLKFKVADEIRRELAKIFKIYFDKSQLKSGLADEGRGDHSQGRFESFFIWVCSYDSFRHSFSRRLASKRSCPELSSFKTENAKLLIGLTHSTRTLKLQVTKRDLMKAEREKLQKENDTIVAEQERNRQVEILPEQFAMLTKGIQVDRKVSTEAAKRCESLIKEGRRVGLLDWPKISMLFHEAERNVPEFTESDVQGLRELIDDLIDDRIKRRKNIHHLDIGVLGFGWRNDYYIVRGEYYDKRKELVKELRARKVISPNEIHGYLKIEGFEIDPRTQCDKMAEVASIFAEAGYWGEALELLNLHCLPPKAEQKAALVGYFSVGIQDYKFDNFSSIATQVVKFAETIASENPENLAIRSAIASLSHHMATKLKNKKGLHDYGASDFSGDTAEAVRLRSKFQDPHVPLINLISAQVSGQFEKLGHDHEQFKAYIDAIFEAQRKRTGPRAAGPFQLKSRLYHEYYKVMHEPWLAYVWLEEALNCHAPNEHVDILNRRASFEKAMFGEFRIILGQDSFKAENKLERILKVDLPEWDKNQEAEDVLTDKQSGKVEGKPIHEIPEETRSVEPDPPKPGQQKDASWSNSSAPKRVDTSTEPTSLEGLGGSKEPLTKPAIIKVHEKLNGGHEDENVSPDLKEEIEMNSNGLPSDLNSSIANKTGDGPTGIPKIKRIEPSSARHFQDDAGAARRLRDDSKEPGYWLAELYKVMVKGR